MTDATPPFIQLPPQAAQTAKPAGVEGVLKAALQSAPADIGQALEFVRLRGEIVRTTAQQQIQIRTERGQVIELRLPPEAPPPPPAGTRVEVEIPPPPREPQQQVQQAQAPERPVTLRALPPETSVQTVRDSATPVKIQIQEPPAKTPDVQLAPPLQTGAELRLQPLPENLAKAVQPFQTPEAQSVKLPALPASQNIQTSIKPSDLVSTLLSLKSDNAPSLLSAAPISAFPDGLEKSEVLNVLQPGAPKASQFFSSVPEGLQSSPEKLISLRADIKELFSFPALLEDLTLKPALVASKDLQTLLSSDSAPIKTGLETITAQLQTITQPGPVLVEPDKGPEILSSKDNNISATANPAAILGQAKPESLNVQVTGVVQHSLPVVSFSSALPLDGFTISSENSFILHTPLAENIGQGTQLQLTPQNPGGVSVSSGMAQAMLPLLPASMMVPGAWPVMDEIQTALQQSAPAMAQAMNAVSINPGNPGQIMLAALFFIAAVRGGDIQSWLGEKTIETLRQSGKGSLLQRLGQEGGLLSRLSSEPVSQDWRGMALPISHDNEIHKIVLHYKQDDSAKDDEERDAKGTRFLMDLSLSRMGKVQLDGLFRGSTLDMIVRTEQPFSQAAQVSLRGLYSSALEFEGLAGSLSFQNKPEQWVFITAECEKFGVEA